MTSPDPSDMYNHRELLSHLHRGGEWAYWWVVPGQRSFWWEVVRPTPVPSGENTHVYFGVHPSAESKGPHKRARVEDIMLINCLFADFDAKDFDGSTDKTLRHINERLLPTPSVTVRSGGGYHCYWLLESPFHLDTEESRQRAISLQRRWVDFVGSDPGSYNWKAEYGPDFPRVAILDAHYDRRYTLEQLERDLETLEPYREIESSTRSGMSAVPPVTAGGEDRYAQAALRHELAILTGAREGNRNNQLNTSAFSLGQFVGASRLDRSEVEYRLQVVARGIGLDEREIERTIRSGLEAGMTEPRWPEEGPGRPEPDSPDNGRAQRSTWPYAVQDGRIVFLKEERSKMGSEIKQVPVADFYARIAEEIITDDDTHFYRLEGQAVRGGDFEVEIPAEDFSSGAKLKAHLQAAAGPLDPVHAYMTRRLSPAISILTGEDVKRTKLYHRTGWAGRRFLLPGREPTGAVIELPDDLPYRTNPSADLERGLEALEALIRAMGAKRGAPILSFLFQAPMAKLSGWRDERYCLFVSGRTGSLKTSFAQTAMAIYGPEFARDDLLTKWGEGATRNAMMSLATHLHDMPFLIDNFKPSTGRGTNGFVNLIHNILEGGEKKRLNRAAQLKESKPIFCWPLVTGEDVPDKDSATLARILVVSFAWQRGEANDLLSKAQELVEHLPAVGTAWLGWLETDAGRAAAREARDLFPKRRKEWADHLRTLRPDMVNILRIASNLASNQLTWHVLEQHPQIRGVAKRYRDGLRSGLAAVARALSTQTAEALGASQYLDAIKNLLAANKCVLLERGETANSVNAYPETCIGWHDGNGGAYLIPGVAKKEVEGLIGREALGDLSSTALYRQLYALGAIASHNKDVHTKMIRVSDRTLPTLHIASHALGGAGTPAVEDGSSGPDRSS